MAHSSRTDGRTRASIRAKQYDRVMEAGVPKELIPRPDARFALGQRVSYCRKIGTGVLVGESVVTDVVFSSLGRNYFYEVAEFGRSVAFREDELVTMVMLPKPTKQVKAIGKPILRYYMARVAAHLLAWFTSGRRYYLNHQVAVTPGYVLWRLMVEAQAGQVVTLEQGIWKVAA